MQMVARARREAQGEDQAPSARPLARVLTQRLLINKRIQARVEIQLIASTDERVVQARQAFFRQLMVGILRRSEGGLP